MDGTVNSFAAEPQSNTPGAPGISRSALESISAPAAWSEISLVFGLILLAVWTPVGLVNTVASLLAVSLVLWFTSRGPYSWRGLGFAVPARGTLITLGLGVATAALIAASGAVIRPILGPAHAVPMHRAWQYAIWAVAQEFILQSFFYLRLKSLLGHRRAAWWAALLFAAVHVPSPLLTALSFVGALLFCELFHRYRALVPIGLAHALLGLTIAATLPDSLLHHMRVGIGYLMCSP